MLSAHPAGKLDVIRADRKDSRDFAKPQCARHNGAIFVLADRTGIGADLLCKLDLSKPSDLPPNFQGSPSCLRLGIYANHELDYSVYA
jgi:hypothetical protein